VRVRTAVLDRLESASSPARDRQAAAIFFGRRPRPLDRLIAGAYFAAAAGRWARWADEPGHAHSLEAGLASCRPPRVAVDIGTGSGVAAAAVARRFPDASVIGTDPSRRMLSQARRSHRDAGLSFRSGTAAHLPIAPESVDLAICLNAVPDPVELGRVLGPAGQALVASSTRPLADRAIEWRARWRDLGFELTASGDAGSGSWELFEVSRRG
jgi:SAM-dependent methyltransferase